MKKLFSVLLTFSFTVLSAQAYVDRSSKIRTLMVGVQPAEIADINKNIIQGKHLIAIPLSDNWREDIAKNAADEIILKQNSGFVGLYTPNGTLVREVYLHETAYDKEHLEHPLPSTNQDIVYKHVEDYGYRTGGRVDPYRPNTLTNASRRDNKRLSPGYGYNSQSENPPTGKRSRFIDFMNFFPINAATPFNYPGNFDNQSLSASWALGAIPHVAGLFATTKRASAEQKDYQYYSSQEPSSYSERPVVYQRGNPYEPTNPMTIDPNLLRSQTMPVSYQSQYGGTVGGAEGNLGNFY